MQKESKSLFSLADYSADPNNNDYKKVAAWFLGPKAENGEQFLKMLHKSIIEHIEVRQNYYEDEEPYIDNEIKSAAEYQEALAKLDEKREKLSIMMKESVPFFSQRYQGHMLWDTLMAGNLGYITAMLYNQNNVATEASPVTSHLEYLVGKQLCGLMGFPEKESWGHITADGTIANIEAVWAARNMKAYALAVREMLLTEKCFLDQRERLPEIVLSDGTMKCFTDCSAWELLNLLPETIWDFFDTIAEVYKIKNLSQKLEAYLLARKGIAKYAERYPEFSRMKIIIPATHHYSWTKSATLLGLGEENVIKIPVDEECKMDIKVLKEQLKLCLREKNPVLITVAVIGSTAEGAVDNLNKIIEYRKALRKEGLNYHIHCDAAWGGYLRTMLIHPNGTNQQEMKPEYFKCEHPVYNLPLSDYALQQYRVIPDADTLTVDPHKAGFIPYPSGALCYHNKRLRDQIACDASYIHSNSEDKMGIYGIEGSKPGAAAAAVWLAHETVALDKSGYGLILGECSYSSKLNYCNWLCMSGDIAVKRASGSYTFSISPLIALPKFLIDGGENEYAFQSYNEAVAYIRENIIGKSSAEIAGNQRALYILRNVGADVLINPFVVNFAKDGVHNTDVKKINDLNERLFEKFSLSEYKEGKTQETHPKFILMMNKLSFTEYEKAFAHIMDEWGIEKQDIQEENVLNVLVNTVMQPWPNSLDAMNYIKKAFKEGVEEVLNEIIE